MPPDAPGVPPGPHPRAPTGKQVGRPTHSPAAAVGTSEGSDISASAACSLGSPAGGPELRCTFGSCDVLPDGGGTSPTSSSSLADCSGVMEPALERCEHPHLLFFPDASIRTVTSARRFVAVSFENLS